MADDSATPRKARRSPYERDPQPRAGLPLEERDREIVRQVYAFGLMTRAQIERLLFPPDEPPRFNRRQHGPGHSTKTSICQRRLRLLFQHGYLDRFPLLVDPDSINRLAVYRLTTRGAALIAEEMGASAKTLDYWGRRYDRERRRVDVRAAMLYHRLAINDFRIAVLLAARAAGYTVAQWRDESALKRAETKEVVTIATRDGRSRQEVIIPDAYFVLQVGDEKAPCFLELDRATEDVENRWLRKVKAYRAYFQAGRYGGPSRFEQRYGVKSIRVLTVTTSAARRDHLKALAEREGREATDRFLFTTFEQVTPAQVLAAPIWLRAGERAPQALIDRADTPLT